MYTWRGYREEQNPLAPVTQRTALITLRERDVYMEGLQRRTESTGTCNTENSTHYIKGARCIHGGAIEKNRIHWHL